MCISRIGDVKLNMQKVVASIQVRLSSERLPGKVLMEINKKPLLGYLIDRLKQSKLIDQIIVATSINEENEKISEFCDQQGILCFRGSEDDVLSRMTEALSSAHASHGVEVYGDCPLIAPEVVDYTINEFFNAADDYDFVGNNLKTTFPPGMEVEIFKLSALIDANNRVKDNSIREHGTLYIRQNPDLYKLKNIIAPKKWCRPDLEIEVDTKEDFYVVSKILEHFNYNSSIPLTEIIDFLESRPDLVRHNSQIERRWKSTRKIEF